MKEYFDEDFFKFLLGFIAIVSISLIIILATRIYIAPPNEENNSVAMI
jgi:hypothetical protein